MDSVPLIVIGGQTISPMLGKDAFRADVFGITAPTVKHVLDKSLTMMCHVWLRSRFILRQLGDRGP